VAVQTQRNAKQTASTRSFSIAVLGGDGVGPEVMAEGLKLLAALQAHGVAAFTTQPALIGGAAIDATGTALPDETVALCLKSDAVLLGAVGGPKWDDPRATVRPEQGLLGIRKRLGVFANLRPVQAWEPLLDAARSNERIVQGTDMIVVRELTGGLYFGQPRGRSHHGAPYPCGGYACLYQRGDSTYTACGLSPGSETPQACYLGG